MSEDLLDDNQNESNELPQMLNVLTILTFIGSGLAFILSLYQLLTKSSQIEKANDAIEQLQQTGSDNFLINGAIEALEMSIEHFTLLNLVPIIAAILCIIGAILMRKLKKNGYYIYILGCISEIAIPAIAIGGAVLGGMLLVGSIFSILFIILYGVNLKHMR
jgi:hypothetical protein